MPASPEDDGLRFAHIDEVPRREAVAQLHGERRVGVHLRVLEWSDRWFVSYTRYDPGLVLARHAHKSNSTVFIVEGEVHVGERLCPAGTLIVLDQDVFFGPLIAGPEGCTLLESYAGDVTSVHEDDAAYESMLATRGIVQVRSDSDVSKEMPKPGPD
jgi:hypothetical protein